MGKLSCAGVNLLRGACNGGFGKEWVVGFLAQPKEVLTILPNFEMSPFFVDGLGEFFFYSEAVLESLSYKLFTDATVSSGCFLQKHNCFFSILFIRHEFWKLLSYGEKGAKPVSSVVERFDFPMVVNGLGYLKDLAEEERILKEDRLFEVVDRKLPLGHGCSNAAVDALDLELASIDTNSADASVLFDGKLDRNTGPFFIGKLLFTPIAKVAILNRLLVLADVRENLAREVVVLGS